MDHEREESLRDLQILIETRKHLEDDEQYWFLHALSSATHRLVLSYVRHDLDGSAYERSAFLGESEKVLPGLTADARQTTFSDVVPPLLQAENPREFFAGLAYSLRTEREPARREELAAAYAGCPAVHGADSILAELFRRAQGQTAVLADPAVLADIAARQEPFSASELQNYLDCPFLWFAAACLRVEPVMEEFSALDRGTVLHAVLEQLYRARQRRAGEPVNLGDADPEALWVEVEPLLRAQLEQEPRYQNRAGFLRDIEWDSLRRMMRRFLQLEVARARTRRTHPAYFEWRFGYQRGHPLLLGDGVLAIRGAIDRVDLADADPSGAVVVDYKSSATMTQKELENGQVLQAPIYALALQRLYHLRTLGVEFMGLKQGASRGIYREGIKELYGVTHGISVLADADWEAYLKDNEAHLCDAVARLRQGIIALAPQMKRCPASCTYFALCRGDRFALLRKQRLGAGGEATS
jgi:ATP-dependent helicase/DNAse subunit B